MALIPAALGIFWFWIIMNWPLTAGRIAEFRVQLGDRRGKSKSQSGRYPAHPMTHTDSSKPLEAVLVGCGGISASWLQPACKLPGFRIAGLVDINLDAAEKLRAEFALEAMTGSDLPAVLTAVRPDVVFNCTIPEAHRDITLAALAAGAHVLSEKPLADSLDAAKELVDAAHRAGRILAVVQNYRYGPGPRAVESALRSGVIGEITEVHCDFAIGAHFDGFRTEIRHVLLLDMAIHHFDLARLFSARNARRVYCHEWNPVGSWYRHGAAAHAIFELEDGVVFNYRGSWCAEGMNTPWPGRWRVTGTHGSLTWDGEGHIAIERVTAINGFRSEVAASHVEPNAPIGKDGGHGGVIAEFLTCVRDGRVPETVATDNYHTLAMIFAAIASAETAQPTAVAGL